MRILSSVTLTVLLGVLAPLTAAAAGFRDVPASHPNYDAILYVQEQGIVEGYADGTYKPDQTINRAEFVKILAGVHWQWIREQAKIHPEQAWEDSMCIATFSDPEINFPFKDVKKTDWFAHKVCLAWSQMLIGGYPDGTFRPGNKINFVEAAKILATQHLITAKSLETLKPSDPWYKEYVEILTEHNAIPLSITFFGQQLTRGEMAEMIYRLKASVTTKSSQTWDTFSMWDHMTMYTDSAAGFSIRYPADWRKRDGEDDFWIDLPQSAFPSGMRFVSQGYIRITTPAECPAPYPAPGTVVQKVQLGGRTFTAFEYIEGAAGTSFDTITFTSPLSSSSCLVLEKIVGTGMVMIETDADRNVAKEEEAWMQDVLKRVLKTITFR